MSHVFVLLSTTLVLEDTIQKKQKDGTGIQERKRSNQARSLVSSQVGETVTACAITVASKGYKSRTLTRKNQDKRIRKEREIDCLCIKKKTAATKTVIMAFCE